MNKWRPEGWKNPYADSTKTYGFENHAPVRVAFDTFEEGADAILEALKENGAWMTPEQMKLLAPDIKYPYGYLVFIPTEKPVSSEVSEQEAITLNKAIQVLEHFVKSGGVAPSEATRDAAIKLGIEGLKRVDSQRIGFYGREIQLLPGEVRLS